MKTGNKGITIERSEEHTGITTCVLAFQGIDKSVSPADSYYLMVRRDNGDQKYLSASGWRKAPYWLPLQQDARHRPGGIFFSFPSYVSKWVSPGTRLRLGLSADQRHFLAANRQTWPVNETGKTANKHRWRGSERPWIVIATFAVALGVGAVAMLLGDKPSDHGGGTTISETPSKSAVQAASSDSTPKIEEKVVPLAQGEDKGTMGDSESVGLESNVKPEQPALDLSAETSVEERYGDLDEDSGSGEAEEAVAVTSEEPSSSEDPRKPEDIFTEGDFDAATKKPEKPLESADESYAVDSPPVEPGDDLPREERDEQSDAFDCTGGDGRAIAREVAYGPKAVEEKLSTANSLQGQSTICTTAAYLIYREVWKAAQLPAAAMSIAKIYDPRLEGKATSLPGLPRDAKEAQNWYRKAADAGDSSAAEALDSLRPWLDGQASSED